MFRRHFTLFSAAQAKASSHTATGIRRQYSPEEIHKALNIRPEQSKAFPLNPAQRSWAAVNVVQRSQFQSFLSTTPNEPLLAIRNDKTVKPLELGKSENALSLWETKSFDSVKALVNHYESAIKPALDATAKISDLTLEKYGLKDVLKLKKAPAEVLKKSEARLAVVEADIYKLKAERKEYVSKTFDTATYNSLINIFRLCGENDEHAYFYSLRLLDDMTVLEVPFDTTTQILLKNISFGDEPGEDSDMLFAFVEFPEMGEVSLGQDSVEVINDKVLKTIGKRHDVEITAGLHLHDKGTYPMIPRAKDDEQK